MANVVRKKFSIDDGVLSITNNTTLHLDSIHCFNSKFKQFSNIKSDELLYDDNINSTLQNIFSNQENFGKTVAEHTFFCNIQKILSGIKSNKESLWLYISVLERAVKDREVCSFLINKIKIMPTITKLMDLLADKLDYPNRLRLLTLIQDLTYGIKILNSEPYLVKFINLLINLINQDVDESIKPVALSTLVNLCYKNLFSITILAQSVDILKFKEKIKSSGLLSLKMIFTLSKYTHLDYKILAKGLLDIDTYLRNLNISALRHILEIVIDAHVDKSIREEISKIDFGKSIENWLKVLNNSVVESKKFSQNEIECINIFLQLINELIKLLSNENENSLRLLYNELGNISRFFATNIDVGPVALQTLELIVLDKSNAVMLTDAKNTILRLIGSNQEFISDSSMMISIIRLVIVLLQQKSDIFDKLFISNITNIINSIKNSDYMDKDLTNNELYITLLTLKVLQIYDSHANDSLDLAYWYKVDKIQYYLARGMLSKIPEMCQLIFELAKTENFPIVAVSNIISEHAIPNDFSKIEFKQDIPISTYSTDQRLDNLIQHLTDAKNNNKLNNVSTTDIMEIYEYQLNNLRNKINNFNETLSNLTEQITNLTQFESTLQNENKTVHAHAYNLSVICESLRSENVGIQEKLTIAKDTMEANREKSLTAKKKCDELHKAIKGYEEKIQYLKQLEKSSTDENKEFKRIIKHKEKACADLNKTLSKLETTLKEKDTILAEMEEKLKSSDIKIEQVEKELVKVRKESDETNEKLNTILSVINKKK